MTRTAVAAPPPPEQPGISEAIRFLRAWESDPAAVLLMRGPRAQEILARHVRVLLTHYERRIGAHDDD